MNITILEEEKIESFLRQYGDVTYMKYVVISFLGNAFIPETPKPILEDENEKSCLIHEFNKALNNFKLKLSNTCWFVKEKVQYVVVCNLRESQIHSLLKQCSKNIKETIICPITIAAGEIINGINDLKWGINSALNYAEYARFIGSKFDIIDHFIMEKLQEELLKQNPSFEMENYERALISSIFKGDFTQAKVVTHYFMISHLLRDIKIFSTIRQNMYNILRLNLALMVKNPRKLHTKDKRFTDIFDSVLEIENLNDMQAAINTFYNLTSDFVKTMKEFSIGHSKVQPIINYIKDNYSNPLICENQVCEKFGISTSYLSHIFKAQTGMSFTVYIQTLRVEKAKHLIINTDDSMNIIARKIGYSSGESMLKMFKRILGLSPSQFKKNYYRMIYDKVKVED
jgi:YesN/AraC family two-component response regulator